MPPRSFALLTCERRAVALGHQHVAAIGEIDLATGPRLTDALRAAQANARDVVLDLEATTFMDMSGVRVLLAAAEHAQATTGTFAIIHATAPVTRMLTLTGADRALENAFPPAKGAGDGARAASPLPARNRPSPAPFHSSSVAVA
jgi:anti-sigma B factor antagonist